MACFTRSVVWRFWTAVLLLSDMLLHLVHAGTLEENSDYQACVASPSTCGILSLSGLGLSGTLPTELGLLTAMTRFFVYNNNLDSTLPTELGLMTAMTHLQLWNNNLEGTLPTELELLTAVIYFYVFGNAGLCGPLVDVGNVGYTYGDVASGHHTTGTNLENACPTIAPTSTPTATTSTPTATTSTPTATTSTPTATTSSPTDTSSPTNPAADANKPCCEELRQNPVFCCIEAKKPALAQSVCQECGTGK